MGPLVGAFPVQGHTLRVGERVKETQPSGVQVYVLPTLAEHDS
jgi:hypothetical protein